MCVCVFVAPVASMSQSLLYDSSKTQKNKTTSINPSSSTFSSFALSSPSNSPYSFLISPLSFFLPFLLSSLHLWVSFFLSVFSSTLCFFILSCTTDLCAWALVDIPLLLLLLLLLLYIHLYSQLPTLYHHL